MQMHHTDLLTTEIYRITYIVTHLSIYLSPEYWCFMLNVYVYSVCRMWNIMFWSLLELLEHGAFSITSEVWTISRINEVHVNVKKYLPILK